MGGAAGAGETAGVVKTVVAAEGEALLGAAAAKAGEWGSVLYSGYQTIKFISDKVTPYLEIDDDTDEIMSHQTSRSDQGSYGDVYAASPIVAHVRGQIERGGDIDGAAQYLQELEQSGTGKHTLNHVLGALSPENRSDLLTAIRADILEEHPETEDYFEVLADGRPFSDLENMAFNDDYQGALDGFLNAPDGSEMTGYGLATRLQQVTPDTGAVLLSLWTVDLSDNPTDNGGFDRLEQTLQQFNETDSDSFSTTVMQFAEESPWQFNATIETMSHDVDNAPLLANILESISVGERVDALQVTTQTGDVASLLELINQNDVPEFQAMSPEAQTEVTTYLQCKEIAQDNAAEFGALESNPERTEFLEDLTASGEPEQYYAAASLLRSLSGEDAALTLYSSSSPFVEGVMPVFAAEMDTTTPIGQEYFSDFVTTLGICGAGTAPSDGGDNAGTGGGDATGGAAGTGGGGDATGGAAGAGGDGGATGGAGGDDPNRPNGSGLPTGPVDETPDVEEEDEETEEENEGKTEQSDEENGNAHGPNLPFDENLNNGAQGVAASRPVADSSDESSDFEDEDQFNADQSENEGKTEQSDGDADLGPDNLVNEENENAQEPNLNDGGQGVATRPPPEPVELLKDLKGPGVNILDYLISYADDINAEELIAMAEAYGDLHIARENALRELASAIRLFPPQTTPSQDPGPLDGLWMFPTSDVTELVRAAMHFIDAGDHRAAVAIFEGLMRNPELTNHPLADLHLFYGTILPIARTVPGMVSTLIESAVAAGVISGPGALIPIGAGRMGRMRLEEILGVWHDFDPAFALTILEDFGATTTLPPATHMGDGFSEIFDFSEFRGLNDVGTAFAEGLMRNPRLTIGFFERTIYPFSRTLPGLTDRLLEMAVAAGTLTQQEVDDFKARHPRRDFARPAAAAR